MFVVELNVCDFYDLFSLKSVIIILVFSHNASHDKSKLTVTILYYDVF